MSTEQGKLIATVETASDGRSFVQVTATGEHWKGEFFATPEAAREAFMIEVMGYMRARDGRLCRFA